MSIKPVRQKRDAAIGLFIFAGMALGIIIPATAQSAKPTVEQLQKEIKQKDLKRQKEIKQRDPLIRSLVQRVEKLEQQVGTSAPLARGVTANRAGTRNQPANPPVTTTEVAVRAETAQKRRPQSRPPSPRRRKSLPNRLTLDNSK